MKIYLLLFALIVTPIFASNTGKTDLDMKSVQSNFREGELEVVKNLLESFLKHQSTIATRDEKIFAYKYLGVIYASNASDKLKAESYFNQLLPLAPNIELADMYVSQNIQDIFDKVKKDYLHTQEYRSHFDAFGNPIVSDNTTPKKNGPKKSEKQISPSSNSWIWWTTAGVAAIGGAAILLWVIESEQKPSGGKSLTGAL